MIQVPHLFLRPPLNKQQNYHQRLLRELCGRDAFYKKDNEEALGYLTQAVNLVPQLPGPYAWRHELPYTFRAILAIEDKDPDTAIKMLDRSSVYDNNAEVTHLRSVALRMKERRVGSTYYKLLSWLKVQSNVLGL